MKAEDSEVNENEKSCKTCLWNDNKFCDMLGVILIDDEDEYCCKRWRSRA